MTITPGTFKTVATSRATAEKSSSGLAPSATSVATRRSAACSSASARARASEAALVARLSAFASASATSSRSSRRAAPSARKLPRELEAVTTPQLAFDDDRRRNGREEGPCTHGISEEVRLRDLRSRDLLASGAGGAVNDGLARASPAGAATPNGDTAEAELRPTTATSWGSRSNRPTATISASPSFASSSRTPRKRIGAAPRATRVATRRSAACSSARRTSVTEVAAPNSFPWLGRGGADRRSGTKKEDRPVLEDGAEAGVRFCR